MSPAPLFLLRGAVCLINFPSDDPKRPALIPKFALCLQQGSILHNRVSFVGVLLTTCKDNNKPRIPAWKVYVSPAESNTEFGVLTDCGQIYTFPLSDIIKYEYSLDAATMTKVDQALQFGIGVLKVEDFKK